MYRHTKPVDWCQCCLWRVSLADAEGSSDFFRNHNSPQVVDPSNNASCFHFVYLLFAFVGGGALDAPQGHLSWAHNGLSWAPAPTITWILAFCGLFSVRSYERRKNSCGYCKIGLETGIICVYNIINTKIYRKSCEILKIYLYFLYNTVGCTQ